MHDLWPAAGYRHLKTDAHGWLQSNAAYVGHLLTRPELALVEESCRAERALHRALQGDPLRPVTAAELRALRDADARENYAHFIAVRDGQLNAGSLQGWLLQLFRSGRITVPPLFIDLAVQAVVQHLLQGETDALAWRAGELFFRAQRITTEQGRLLAADRDSLDHEQATQGLGEIGRLLAQARAPLKTLQLRVLDADSAPRWFEQAAQPEFRSTLLLDLTHTVQHEIGQGIAFTMTAARSGLKPLAVLIERWVQHFLGAAVRVQPLQKIEDAQWRWHLGLDAEASKLLDDLYEGTAVEPQRLARLISLFRLEFENAAEMRQEMRQSVPQSMQAGGAGKPVYLALMATADGSLRMKPQNLLLNLPLAVAS